LLKKNIS